MRKLFFDALKDIGRQHNALYLLTANVGFRLFDDFRIALPGQFLDTGIAEANMIGLAAGLSLSGKNVYCYSMIPFLLMRAYEQIRVDIAYHNLNVKLIGFGGGFTYGREGFTHFGIEDLAIMRLLPNMSIVVPADKEEVKQLAETSFSFPSPLYIRLGKATDTLPRSTKQPFEIGKGAIIAEGQDICIIAIGDMVACSYKAVELLKKQRGISATLVNMHTLRPLDSALIDSCARAHRAIFTVEEHSITGGLGSAVAEVLSESIYKGVFHRIGIPERLERCIGSADFLRAKYGLTEDGIVTSILNKLKET